MEIAQKRMWNRDRFLNDLDSGQLLPSLSPLTLQLMKLASDENCSLADIADLIEKDPALTIRIVKLANSAFFRSRYPVVTAHSALLRIGVDQARLLALSLSLKNTFPLTKVGSADYGQYWRMSVYQGLIAKFLVDKEDAEEAFMAAFTLEIGLLVFLHMFLDPEDPVDMPPWFPLSSLLDWESETYGVNHREIGELLLTHWGFPSRLILCQRSYQFGHSAAGLPSLARICAIASQLSSFICQSKACLPDVLATMEQVFGLSPGLIADAVSLALMKVDSIAEMFDVQADSEEDKLEVMRKAHNSLALLSQKLIERRRLLCSTSSLTEVYEQPGDNHVKHALQAIEHEIRNPLTAVGGFARRLAKTVDPASDQGEYIRIIISETARLEQTLNGIGQVLRQ